jgi:transposase
MEEEDFRSIGRVAQEALQRRALWLVEQQGLSQGEVARLIGVQRQTVNLWVKRQRELGEDGVLDGRRVSPRRGKGLLTAAQCRQVRGWIADKSPDQLKLPFALWTARAVLELIEQQFGIQLGLSTVQLYLRRWGMSPQKPLLRARERSPAAIAAWLERDYPAIASQAKREGAVIYWSDETGVNNQDQTGRGWSPKGQTPVVTRNAKRFGGSMISGVSNRGLMRFMLYDGALNADLFLTFLRRLIKDAKQKVFLIVDNLRVHHARKVKAWVAARAEEIELFYLPAYAPEHNPDEHLNNDLKQQLRQKPQPKTKEQLKTNIRSVLRHIQRTPPRIKSYFSLPAVRYAA